MTEHDQPPRGVLRPVEEEIATGSPDEHNLEVELLGRRRRCKAVTVELLLKL